MKKIDLGQSIAILANVGVLISGNLVAQEPNFVLGDTYVYGTERLDAAAIRSEFATEFERISVLMSASDSAEAEAEGEEITNQITEALRSRGPFSFLAVGFGYVLGHPA